MPDIPASPLAIADIRRYIAFKVLFNSRFYYPVFTILFLDFGLTVAQFSILNAVWAATIVLSEVPSGALADTIGRKRLLTFATATMVVEVGLIAFAPAGNPNLVFWIFFFNRILSGLAEAAASGADEALAYDALKERGDPNDWGRVLEVMTRCQSVGFIIAMTLGAAIYDPALMNRALEFLGANIVLSQDQTMRFPLYATLLLALGACWAVYGMTEIRDPKQTRPQDPGGISQLRSAFSLTLKAGLWVLSTPFVLAVILMGMLFDGTIRMVITLSSQYYRMIHIPESLFGLMGAGVAVLGLFIPKLARKLAESRSPGTALCLTAGLTLTGLFSMNFFWPWYGIVPAVITYAAMYFNGFFISFYLNRETASSRRATVLSFKGLSYNLAYGLLGTGYALLLKIEKQTAQRTLSLEPEQLDNWVFTETFWVFPLFFVTGLVVLLLFFKFRKKSEKPI